MNGTEKQEKSKDKGISCFYLTVKQRNMIETLVGCGHYKNKSDVVRAAIEKLYNSKISNPKELLREKEKELEKVIALIKEEVVGAEDALVEIVKQYKERRKNIPARAMDKYEIYSKNWITKNIELANIAFPGKTVEDIYTELEKLIKV